MMRSMLLSTPEELKGLRGEWLALWRRSESATPFQSPMWLLPWWRAFGTGELHAVTSSSNGRLESFAPLFVLREDDESLGMLVGTGNSDYTDVLGDADVVLQKLT